MKAKYHAVILAASAALFAVPAIAGVYGAADMHCRGAVAPVAHSSDADHAMNAKDMKHDPQKALGGDDEYRTQSGKRQPRDSIDPMYRGG
ncbi:hypothetical protein AWB79_00671 [Caballeronia hypogeia]|uniref:Uncharacterized protein n=1 Tax=Caballeronia hypogeia TaxID=1777140 RepID=A0A157ZD66_9BURK|nr:hypothetical protein [Caballeronia hypogeia]SAK43476.1 hypothetical protein AWB79_00671 [Caballeronia hypogeia]